MAAWIMVGVVMGLCAGVSLGMVLERWLQSKAGLTLVQEGEGRPAGHVLSAEVTAELISRLMDVSLPKPGRVMMGPEEDHGPQHVPEYDPPPPEVGDWTDPFIGHERRDYMGVGAGAGVPGMDTPDLSPEEWRARGEAAFAEWAQEALEAVPPREGGSSWVERIELDDDTDGSGRS